MTREEAIKLLKEDGCGHCTWQSTNPYECENKECKVKEALEMAIKALSQEPICDRDCEHCTWTECPIEPCDDAISREAVLEAVSEGCQEWRGIYGRCEELINALPSVTQKPIEYDDAVSREDAIEAIASIDDTDGEVAVFTGKQVIAILKDLPPVTQKSGKYTADELREFADGISLSLCSKKSAQHWSYDEKTAEQIRWLECLHSKVMTDIADTNCGARMVEPQESEE